MLSQLIYTREVKNMDMNDVEILENLHNIRNHSRTRRDTYKQAVKNYVKFNGMSLQELLTEAENEEEEGIRWKKRTLKTRLINFRGYLTHNYNINTAKLYLSTIQTIYKHYEIEIHDLPFFSDKNVIQNDPISYDDLPTKEIIKEALKLADPQMRAIILFMSSSGSARRETLNLTIQDFIDSTKEYHNENDIYDVIHVLKRRNDVVPTFRLRRQKTNKYYYTFCSPEAVEAILSYLQSIAKPLTPDTKLFQTNLHYFNERFKKLNIQLGLDKKGGYNRLRSHMLRKFHASNLGKELSMEQVDALQGRSKGNTRNSYFMDNPQNLKAVYIEHMDLITINLDVNTLTLDSPEVLEIRKENIKIIKENQDLKKNIQEEAKRAAQNAVQQMLNGIMNE